MLHCHLEVIMSNIYVRHINLEVRSRRLIIHKKQYSIYTHSEVYVGVRPDLEIQKYSQGQGHFK